MRSIQQIIEVIKRITNVHTDKKVADFLNMSFASLSSHKKRGTIPFLDLLNFCVKKKISFDYMLTGKVGKFDHPSDDIDKENPDIDPDTISHICFERGIFKEKPTSERKYGARGFIGDDAKLMGIINSLMEEVVASKAKIDLLKEMLEDERLKGK